MISGGNGIASIAQSNSEPGCAGALFDDGDLDNKFIKDSSADIVFATVVTTA
jgi:hypothetical protein